MVRKIRARPRKRSLFGMNVKSKRRAAIISIKNLRSFKKSINILLKGRYTLSDQRALTLAQNRARAQLNRKTLSTKERLQFIAIGKVAIPSARKVLEARRIFRRLRIKATKAKEVIKKKIKAGERVVKKEADRVKFAVKKQRAFEKKASKTFDKFLESGSFRS